MSQTQADNPFRPGSGIFPPLLAGRERETEIAMARVARTREGHPHHTALLGEWAIGKTTLLMHWRRLLREVGDVAVLSLAYPQPVGEFLQSLRLALETDVGETPGKAEYEVGVDLGIASARVRQSRQLAPNELKGLLRRLAKGHRERGRLLNLLIDDIHLLVDARDLLLQLRAICLELYADDLPLALIVAAAPDLFADVGAAHESLVRYYEPLSLGPLDIEDARNAITVPLQRTGVRFERSVIDDIADASAGRPFYLQKLAYYAFDAAVDGRVGPGEYRIGFERAFASVSQEIFAARWRRMSPAERIVVRVLARHEEPRRSAEIESEAQAEGVAPGATRQSLRRLGSRSHVARLANGRRGRYVVDDPLFRRYLAMQP